MVTLIPRLPTKDAVRAIVRRCGLPPGSDEAVGPALFDLVREIKADMAVPEAELHIGLKGTMGALYLKDLADKTRRGLEGRVRRGRSGGGLCYGYRVVRDAPGPDGEPERGLREIDPAQAEVVRRVFRDYAAGGSPTR